MSWLFERDRNSRIPNGELAYVGAAFRSDVHSRVLEAFEKSGISQKDLAQRLNKNPGQISRILGASGNWTLDTVAHLIYAIEGNFVEICITDPDEGPHANYDRPEWLNISTSSSASAAQTYTLLHAPSLNEKPVPSEKTPKFLAQIREHS